MNSIIDNISVVMPFFLISWGVFIGATLWKPQKFRNSIFLLNALFFTVFFMAALAGEYIGNVLLVAFLLVFLALLLVPIMLVINGIVMMKKESRSLGNLLSLLLGLVIGAGEIAFFVGSVLEIHFSGHEYALAKQIAAFIGSSVLYISFWILAFVVYMIFIQFMPHIRDFDYLIIHGAGLIKGDKVSKLLANRIDKAIKIYKKNKRKPIIIPSGGQGGDETVSEAWAMKKYLLEHGIPEEHIILEDKSLNTMENLKNSMDIICSREGRHRVALVTSNYHVYRCLLYAKSLNLKCTGIGAPVAWYYWPSAVIREFVAVFTTKKFLIWTIIGYIFIVLVPTFGYAKMV
ncbi:MAG: YdcF family protein [bacterium]|nr:YdcF family protein [bacterium]